MNDQTLENIPQNESEKLSKIDKFNLGLGIFNFVAVIASIFISIWGVNTSERIAERSGAFDKGELKLSFGGYFIYPNIDFDVYYGVDFSDSSLHFATLPLGMHNTGKKTIENANMLIKYPSIAHIAMEDNYMKYESVFTDPFDRKFATVEPYDQVSIKFNTINPNFSIQSNDLICIQNETIYRGTFPVMTKDSVKLNINAAMQYSYPIQIALTAKDIVTEQYSFVLNYRKEADLNELIKKIIREKLSDKNKEKVITSFFVIIPKVNKVQKVKNYSLTFMNSDASNTLFCEFDKTMKFVAVMNQDGTLQQQIDLANFK